ncbi:uncharacterized protein PV09_02087 [Verruconis gallopava]|uniref:Cell wall mannoprotein 1 n=1 Tax=Verruconis gallopava TaxID=253628 RepID=A0A0D2AL18_9PEZI|nr:uncharacterized protein PV09_02087 [Verruconis gallopava]KIW07230.1 hypothetical protein PV09_02087 [Verruconis gallopava]
MRFFSILAAAGFVTAQPSIYERQVATIVGVLSQINTDTQALDTAVKGFNGAGDIQSLQAAADKVATSVTNGVQTVNSATSISLTDALQLQSQVQNLQSTIESTVNDLISKKSALVSAGAGPQVSQNLNAQLSGSQQLATAISGKVPSEVATLAGQLASGITSALQKGVNAFQDVGAASTTASAVATASESRSASAKTTEAASTKASQVASTRTSQRTSATSSRNPATFTGAAMPQAVVGSFAGVAGLLAIAL